MSTPGQGGSRSAALVSVSAWGELRGERKMPGCVRVLVDGQSAGGAERVGQLWRACWYTARYQDRITEHATAEEAVRAVIRSGWSRHLGARRTSTVTWTPRARRMAGEAGK